MELRPGDQPTQSGEQCPLGRPEDRTGHLSAEDGHLMTEHDDLDGQIGLIGPLQAEDLHGPEEGEIEEREGHKPFSRSYPLQRKVQFTVLDEVLGTHTVQTRDFSHCAILGPRDAPQLQIFVVATCSVLSGPLGWWWFGWLVATDTTGLTWTDFALIGAICPRLLLIPTLLYVQQVANLPGHGDG